MFGLVVYICIVVIQGGAMAGPAEQDVILTEADIPGANLSEPFERHTIPALRWWLLCRGISVPRSWNKAKLIARYKFMHLCVCAWVGVRAIYCWCRMREAAAAGATIVDVDGSYRHKKHKALTDAGVTVAALTPQAPPLSGWVTVSSDNYMQLQPNLPAVTAGQLSTSSYMTTTCTINSLLLHYHTQDCCIHT